MHYPSDDSAAKKGVQKLNHLLSQHMVVRGYGRTLQTAELELAWEQIVGPAMAATAIPGQLKRGVLEIFVSHPTVLQELTFRRGELNQEVQQRLPHFQIKELKFRVR